MWDLSHSVVLRPGLGKPAVALAWHRAGAGNGMLHPFGLCFAGRAIVKWDLEKPFIDEVRVQPADIDELGHANNAVYVRWLERCAWQHSRSLGLGLEEYQQLDRAMVVVRHEIDYLAAAYLDEELSMGTWIVSWDSKLRMTRRFQLCRQRDGVTLLRAHTTFACVELSSGRPRRMPREFIELYGQAIVSA